MGDQERTQRPEGKEREDRPVSKGTSNVEFSPHATFDELAAYARRKRAAGKLVVRGGNNSNLSG